MMTIQLMITDNIFKTNVSKQYLLDKIKGSEVSALSSCEFTRMSVTVSDA